MLTFSLHGSGFSGTRWVGLLDPAFRGRRADRDSQLPSLLLCWHHCSIFLPILANAFIFFFWMAPRRPRVGGASPGRSFLEKVWNKKANSSRSTKFTNESCAARITVEPACPSDTITLVSRELKKQCFVLPIASKSVCTHIKPKKQVDRSSREEVTHTHLNPEGLCAPRKAEKTALH